MTRKETLQKRQERQTANYGGNKYLPYDEARQVIATFGLTSFSEWRKFCAEGKRPTNIPSNPERAYRKIGWVSVMHWLSIDKSVWSKKMTLVGIESNKNKRKENYLTFEESKKFMYSLKLKSTKEFNVYCKSGKKPDNIPSYPCTFYEDCGWISMKDWLGINPGWKRHNTPRNFVVDIEEAKAIARENNIYGIKEWMKYVKSGKSTKRLPVSPDIVYAGKGWISTADFFPRKNYLTYDEAKKFVHTLKLGTIGDYENYAKSEQKPHNIPTNPRDYYREAGWISNQDWIGPNYRKMQRQLMTYEEARIQLKKDGIRTSTQFATYRLTDKKPEGMPGGPRKVYAKEWEGWPKFFELANADRPVPIKSRAKRKYNQRFPQDIRPSLCYEDAVKISSALGLTTMKEWFEWWEKAADKDKSSLPRNPQSKYLKSGWQSWWEWLGKIKDTQMHPAISVPIESLSTLQYTHLPTFQEFKTLVRSSGITNENQWQSYRKSITTPRLLPANPKEEYDEWVSWATTAGYKNIKNWRRHHVLDFLKSIRSELKALDPVELVTIIEQSGSMKKLAHNKKFVSLLEAPAHTRQRTEAVQQIMAEYSGVGKKNKNTNKVDAQEDIEAMEVAEENQTEIVEEVEQHIGYSGLVNELRAFDNENIASSLDSESLEFLVGYRVDRIWNATVSEEFDVEKFKKEEGGIYFCEIRDRFIAEHNAVSAGKLPTGFSYKDDTGELIKPNLMQWLFAYRLANKSHYGNWSGPGSGKTLSAILAGRILNLKKTIIIGFNSTVDYWKETIEKSFPNDTNVTVFDGKSIPVIKDGFNYYITNYETFQLESSEDLSDKLIKLGFEYIVLDEVHKIKQREEDKSSYRRYVISSMVAKMRWTNPNMKLAAMSATPVINNLTEPKKILELLNGVRYDDMETFPNINNAMAMHRQIVLSGIRVKPKYALSVKTTFLPINGLHLLGSLSKTYDESILSIENKLLDDKLKAIAPYIRKGTIIYTYYVDGIVDRIMKFLVETGYTPGIYTGSEKKGLDKFKKGELDVLVGSSPMGTGMDGLQKVCDRMIIITLPWTSSEYENLVGRIYRQGSVFGEVEMIIPQVNISIDANNEWSWDAERLRRIQYKKTLADAVVDGIIPETLLPTMNELLTQSKKALKKWIENVSNDKAVVIERERILISCEDGIIAINQSESIPETIATDNEEENINTNNVSVSSGYALHQVVYNYKDDNVTTEEVKKTTDGMYPVRIDSKTVIFVDHPSKIQAAKDKYSKAINKSYTVNITTQSKTSYDKASYKAFKEDKTPKTEDEVKDDKEKE